MRHDLNKVKKDNQSKISNNNKLTYKLEHELSIIPSEIEKLETIISVSYTHLTLPTTTPV